MKYEDFAQLFDGYSAEELPSMIDFVDHYLKADADTRQALGEFLEACGDGITTMDAINKISNKKVRERWLKIANKQGIDLLQPTV